MKQKSIWIRLALINLCIVALLGFTLRSKILFSIPFLDYRNVLSAHSHFAFSGWVGLAIITLLIYDLLPPLFIQKLIYQWILIGIEVSSLGMAFTFPFAGYTFLSILFSSLYIFVSYLFAFVFIRDLLKAKLSKTITLLSSAALISLVVSSIGPFLLSYIMITKSANAYLYRDSIYTFLHFQYNGFFTLSVFALLANQIYKRADVIGKELRMFSILITASIIPSLFLSLLWHNNAFFYIMGVVGVIFILLSFVFLLRYIRTNNPALLFAPVAKRLFQLSLLSFGIKMLLNVGTIFPTLANEVYGDRPVIIGFLHLVFLGFVSFYLLANFVEQGFFMNGTKNYTLPIVIFGGGIVLNELLLMLQGLGILFKTNSGIFNWLLWGASIILFTGAISIALTQFLIKKRA